MRRLWQGEEVTYYGHVTVEQAQLYVHPPTPPQIIGAALTEATAHWLGSWADGLITTARPLPELQRMIDTFHSGGGQGKRLILKADLSYDPSYEEAVQGAYQQWRYALLTSPVIAELKTTALFDKVGAMVDVETVKKAVKISNHLDDFIHWIKELSSLGFEKIILHNVNRKQEQFIDTFGEKVLPHFSNT